MSFPNCYQERYGWFWNVSCALFVMRWSEFDKLFLSATEIRLCYVTWEGNKACCMQKGSLNFESKRRGGREGW
jgi:hypothetical protein